MQELLFPAAAGVDMTVSGVLTCLAFSLVLGMFLSITYIFSHKSKGYISTFPAAMVLLSPLMAGVTVIINSNVATAISLGGALALLRIRSYPKDTSDIISLLFSLVIGIGCGTGFLTRALLPKIEYSHWWLNDLSEDMCRYAARHLHDNFDILAGDILSSMPDAKLDLIVSASCFQWIEDLEKLIGRIRDWSNPDSILAFSTFGESNFFQLRQLGIEGLKYYSLEETSEILKRAGYEVLHISEDRVDMVFDSPLDVLRHIKITGVNGGFAEFWTPAMAKQFSAQYEKHFNDGDSVTLTYHPVLVVAKKI